MSCELRIPHLENNEFLYPRTTTHQSTNIQHSFSESQLKFRSSFGSPRYDSFRPDSMIDSTSSKLGSFASTRRLGEISASWAVDTRKNEDSTNQLRSTDQQKMLIQELEEVCEKDNSEVDFISNRPVRTDRDTYEFIASPRSVKYDSSAYNHREVDYVIAKESPRPVRYDISSYNHQEVDYVIAKESPRPVRYDTNIYNHTEIDSNPKPVRYDSFQYTKSEIDFNPPKESPKPALYDTFPYNKSELDFHSPKESPRPAQYDNIPYTTRESYKNLDQSASRLELEIDSMINSINRVALVLKRQDIDVTLDKLPDDYKQLSTLEKLLLSRAWTQSLYQDFLLKPKPPVYQPQASNPDSCQDSSQYSIYKDPIASKKPLKSKPTKRTPQPKLQVEDRKCEGCTTRIRGRKCDSVGAGVNKQVVGEPKLRRYPLTKRKLKSLTKKYFI